MRLLAASMLALFLTPATIAQDSVVPEIQISEDLSALPPAVAEKRQALIDAARTGDIESLRPIIAAQSSPPNVSFGAPDDAVDYLISQSADGEGIEPLAILLDLLDAPYAVFDPTGDSPSYVWPYLAVVPDLTSLSPAEKVDAYRLLSHEQVSELVELQAWYYWRVYIAEDGEWQAFVAGD